MKSFILVADDQTQTDEQWQKLCLEYKIAPVDRAILASEQALGIEDIRQIQRTIFLSPAGGNTKGILVRNSQSLTLPAQNAFLKLLEEPPAHALIVLQTPNSDLLLPTILSRCFVIESQPSKNPQPPQPFTQESLTEKEAMELAGEKGKTKEEALSFLASYIMARREKMKETGNREEASAIRSLQKAHTIISTTNVSPRLVLENTLLNL
jgi:DNA polymerase III delta prime subunit